MQTIGITGGTGFVGRHICELLVRQGYRLVIFTRDVTKKSKHDKIKYSFWDPHAKKGDLLQFKNLDAVIHLAGAGVADKRWTSKRKNEILASRVEGTQFLVDQLTHAPKCKTLIA